MRLLITGFEPFGGQAVNPSWQAVSALPDHIGAARIMKGRLPVIWFEAINMLSALIAQHEPDRLLLTGQAGGADGIRIERLGINLCIGKDNAGRELLDIPVIEGAPAAYFASYDYAAIKATLDKARIPAAYSLSAGAYLCNHVLFAALHGFPNLRAGFIHLPYMSGQVEGAACMPLETQVQALELATRAMLQEE